MAGLGAGLREDGELSDDSERKALAALGRYKLAASAHGREAGAGRRDGGGPRCRQRRGSSSARSRGSASPARSSAPPKKRAIRGLGSLSAFPGAERHRRRPWRRQPGADRGRQCDDRTRASRFRSACFASKRQVGRQRPARDASSAASRKRGSPKAGRGKPFYMVGGSWRALAQMDMIVDRLPAPRHAPLSNEARAGGGAAAPRRGWRPVRRRPLPAHAWQARLWRQCS